MAFELKYIILQKYNIVYCENVGLFPNGIGRV